MNKLDDYDETCLEMKKFDLQKFVSFLFRELNAIVILLNELCPVHFQPSSLILHENDGTHRYSSHPTLDDSFQVYRDRCMFHRILYSHYVANKFPDSGVRDRHFHFLFDRDFLKSEI